MSAAWAEVIIAVVVALVSFNAFLLQRGQREGKIDAVLEELKEITKDHESRLRSGGL